ncbi:MAG: rod shape-determining protein RodA [Chlorobi bacterium]|nr:rod shape-determining protein RodA [Chlorobiota bacterium]
MKSKPASIVGQVDVLILFPALLLLAIGLASIYSATLSIPNQSFFERQVIWALMGIAIALVIILSPPRSIYYSAYIWYWLAIAALLIVLIAGKTVGGNAGWLRIGSFGIQPSEFGKVATVMALARFLSDSNTRLNDLRDIGKALGLLLLPWILIALQPDFGTGLVYLIIFIPVMFWAGAEMFLIIFLLSPVIVGILAVIGLYPFLIAAVLLVVVFYLLHRDLGISLFVLVLNLSVGFGTQYFYNALPEYQRERIAVFLDPTRDPLSAGYNVIQSKVAIGSGGWFGKGFLHGTQTQLRFIPEQWTDFIFCVPAEEFGFIGAVLVIVLFLIIITRGFYLASQCDSPFTSILVIGMVSILLAHVFINIGMTLGLLPVIGIPLPLMSYGGSSLLSTMIILGILLHSNLYKHRSE